MRYIHDIATYIYHNYNSNLLFQNDQILLLKSCHDVNKSFSCSSLFRDYLSNDIVLLIDVFKTICSLSCRSYFPVYSSQNSVFLF